MFHQDQYSEMIQLKNLRTIVMTERLNFNPQTQTSPTLTHSHRKRAYTHTHAQIKWI